MYLSLTRGNVGHFLMPVPRVVSVQGSRQGGSLLCGGVSIKPGYYAQFAVDSHSLDFMHSTCDSGSPLRPDMQLDAW